MLVKYNESYRKRFIPINNKQIDQVKTGEPIVKAYIKELSKAYDMTKVMIITDANEKEIYFQYPQTVNVDNQSSN